MIYEYDFPPSEAIKQLGDIVEKSHFVVDGLLSYGNDESIECHFEVGYTKSNTVVAVAYYRFSEEWNVAEKSRVEKAISNERLGTLQGRERFWGLNITVSGLRPINVSQSFPLAYGRLSLSAERFDADANDAPAPRRPAFFLSNFPLPDWYSTRAALDAGEAARRPYTINVADKEIGSIYHLRNLKTRDYATQSLSYLTIRQEAVPLGWSSENVADCVCALLSLAIGCDIKWTSWQIPKHDNWLIAPKQVWISQKIRETRFYGFVREYYPPFDEDLARLQVFLSTTLARLFDRPFEVVKEYVRLLELYIDFVNADSISHTMQGRLLTTLAEELLQTWEKIEGIEKDRVKLTWKPEKKRLIQSIEEILEQKAPEILERRSGELEEEYHGRLDKLKTRIAPIIQHYINKETFEDKLFHFFESHGYRVQAGQAGSISKHIRAFADSRNSFVHSGCLAHNNPEVDKSKLVTFCSREEHTAIHEFENLTMFLPTMFAAILGYRGDYRNAISTQGPTWLQPPLIAHDE